MVGGGRVGNRRQVKPSIRTVWTSYESKNCQLLVQTCLDGLRDISLSLGGFSDPCLPCSALHWSHCLSREFTGSAKLALEKQTGQPSPVMALCMCSVQV